ncbi:MAG TPA: hypothetical protein VJN44_15650 [Roseateles sp.]|nr:hypothetical protein [Roseateles sp.]
MHQLVGQMPGVIIVGASANKALEMLLKAPRGRIVDASIFQRMIRREATREHAENEKNA